jgi:Concanavalin A-like lectin/glucanases superfamily
MKKTKTILALAVVLTTIATSCKKKNDAVDIPLPPIGGYNNSNEVGAANLKAYWAFEGNGTESKTATAPESSIGVTYTAGGAKGQAATFANGYLKYPAIAALTATLSAYTVSAWVKISNNQTATPGSGTVSTFFSLSRPNEWIGNINLYAETGQALAANDSVKVKQGFGSSASGTQIYENFTKLEPWMVADNIITPGKHVAGPNKIGGRWAQIIATWSGTDNKFIIYSDGLKISSPAFEVRGNNTTLVFDAPSFVYIGAFGNVATTPDTWNKPMTGSVDEIRVYNKALSVSEIDALYQLEKAGR